MQLRGTLACSVTRTTGPTWGALVTGAATPPARTFDRPESTAIPSNPESFIVAKNVAGDLRMCVLIDSIKRVGYGRSVPSMCIRDIPLSVELDERREMKAREGNGDMAPLGYANGSP